MRCLLTVMTVVACSAMACLPVCCGADDVAGQTDSGSGSSCSSCRTGRTPPKVIGQTDSGTTQVLSRGTQVNAADQKATARQPTLRSTAEKRRWLRDQLASGVKDRRQLQQLYAKIDNLTVQQVDELTKAALAQPLPAADQQPPVQQGLQQIELKQQQLLQQANQEAARMQFVRQALERELWARNAGYGLGYMPVVTWLPEGTWLGAGVNVSPDGRYVRTMVNPVFSSVGPVYTYNLRTGETRQWMPPAGYPANSQSAQNRPGPR